MTCFTYTTAEGRTERVHDMTLENILPKVLLASGIGHFALCLGSLMVPKALQWKTHLSQLKPLLRQLFWTYAVYILVINFSFGLISILGTEELLNHSFLAKSITLFIALYWIARVFIQFFYFDKSNAPKGVMYTAGEIALVMLFASFSIIYMAAFFYNNTWI